VLLTYTIENRDARPHKVATRVRIDVACNGNPGPLFVASSVPDRILNGVELKGNDVPAFLKVLEKPNLAEPGFVGYLTLKPFQSSAMPDRVILTSHSAGIVNNWDVQTQPSNGDTDCVIFWEAREIPAGGKLVLAYTYGGSVAAPDLSEGRVHLAFGGSFEPGKTFTIMAYVDNPLANQTLSLLLPQGLQLLEGSEIAPVVAPSQGNSSSVVLWKGRVDRLGEFPIHVSSSSGVAQTHMVSVSRE